MLERTVQPSQVELNEWASHPLSTEATVVLGAESIGSAATPNRDHRWRIVLTILVSVALLKILAMILWEYRNYFPPNYESAFLTGRRGRLVGVYGAAFYLHLLSGPVTLLLGGWLLFSGPRSRHKTLHQISGRIQAMLVLFVLVPSGLIMASQALAGPIAGIGFASLALATGGTMTLSVIEARHKRRSSHRLWATRCFILLASPLLLRMVTGATIVLDSESAFTYRLNAWLSWLIPLGVYEIWLAVRRFSPTSIQSQTDLSTGCTKR
ncbi:MAG: DUF2306 domain-containing protein [Planctomycetota bacterium]|nr:DUF2306 domain-containing protein [Planctomycetota bacterium]